MNNDWQPWEWLDSALEGLNQRRLKREPACRGSAQDPASVELNGERFINFSSNDYLGLAADPRLIAAATRACQEVGWGSGASPVVTGRGAIHQQLEHRLAQLESTDAALLFPSGYAANMGAIAALANRGDLILSDAKNHASIIDGCRLSGAEVIVYPHRDVAFVADQLGRRQSRLAGRALIVTDSLFSMDGCLAPLVELADLAAAHNAMMIVDEAHATGVLGDHGRGGCEAAGTDSPQIVKVGTLSKAIGSIGGFVAGPRSVVQWLHNQARTQFFSTAMPEAAAAASLAALDIIAAEPHRRTQLLHQADRLRAALRDQGWMVGGDGSQIVPVILGDPDRALAAAASLRRLGFLAPPIRPPAVPDGESLLRISVSYAHSAGLIDQLTFAMSQIKQR